MSFILLNLSFYLKTSNKTKILTKKGMEMLTTVIFHQDPYHEAIVNKRLSDGGGSVGKGTYLLSLTT